MGMGSKVTELFRQIADHGIDGAGPLCSAVELARQYEDDDSYSDVDERVAALIRWESAKSFSSGFVTGLGGLLPRSPGTGMCHRSPADARRPETPERDPQRREIRR